MLEQRLIDNLAGLCHTSATEIQAYIHTDLIDKFIDWLNNNLELSKNSVKMSWKAIALLDFEESDNHRPLAIGRTKIGYATNSEQQDFYQNLLNQAFDSRLFRSWRA